MVPSRDGHGHRVRLHYPGEAVLRPSPAAPVLAFEEGVAICASPTAVHGDFGKQRGRGRWHWELGA